MMQVKTGHTLKGVFLVWITLWITFGFLGITFAAVDNEQAVRAIIGEAADQGYSGMLAVACAIRNRGTLQGVYGLRASHVDKEPAWVWDRARRAWAESAAADVTGGATHWESTRFPVPYWAKDMDVTLRHKDHIFYKPKGA